MSSYEASFATLLQFLATSGSASTVVKNPSTTVSSVKIWHYIMWRHNAYAAKSHFFYHPTKQAHVIFERTIRHIFSWSCLLFIHIPQNHCFWFTYLQSHQLSWSTHLPKVSAHKGQVEVLKRGVRNTSKEMRWQDSLWSVNYEAQSRQAVLSWQHVLAVCLYNTASAPASTPAQHNLTSCTEHL